MPAPYHDLGEKCEAAFRLVLIAAATGVPDDDILTTFNSNEETRAADNLIVNDQGGSEDGHNSGNERHTLVVRVQTNADQGTDTTPDPRAHHRELTGKTFDALHSTTLAADLSAALPDFTVFDSITRRRAGMQIMGRKFVSEMTLEFSCCPSDIV